jgi:hypothetical protein
MSVSMLQPVLDTREEAREFTVKVQSQAFRQAVLEAQDGPGICFERLEQEAGRRNTRVAR